MARNQEKAQAMLNRLVQMRRDEFRKPVEQRPHLASECHDLHDCDKWRQEIVKEISKEVTLIQNGSLGEHKIRDMNDHINKSLREKKHWERQIKFLGGPDHIANAPKVLDGDGKQAMGADGYFYFGAARELPGVRELFERIIPDIPKRARFDLYKCIDADYYGFRDDDDGLLEKIEKKQEKLSRIQAEKEYKTLHGKKPITQKRKRDESGENKEGDEEKEEEEEAKEEEKIEESNEVVDVYRSHVPLPSQQEIEKLILEKRREELLAKLEEEEEIEELEEEIQEQLEKETKEREEIAQLERKVQEQEQQEKELQEQSQEKEINLKEQLDKETTDTDISSEIDLASKNL